MTHGDKLDAALELLSQADAAAAAGDSGERQELLRQVAGAMQEFLAELEARVGDVQIIYWPGRALAQLLQARQQE